ncbi:hypothetical protein C8J57DRAFT_92320 [Mycena rebaudengoi]|nr:hypothetical protein C8J57DRAFT_92320 [Mycena rebaudengoi]
MQARDVHSSEGSHYLALMAQQLKTIEKSHMFALRCVNEMITRKQILGAQAKSQLPRGTPASAAGNESISLRSAASPAASVVEPPEPPKFLHWDASTHLSRTEPVPETVQPEPITLRSVLPDLRDPRHEPQNVNGRNAPNVNTLVSSTDSHMKNLTALLGISFFGASITWSTVFSGTRGNVSLIAWAACLFIVGAVGAAAASMLVMTDQDVVAMYPTVRWTVRIISLVAMVHVLGGMFLVAVAILVLDSEDEVQQGRRGTRSAGGYAISVSVMLVMVAGAVWRRYTRRTWLFCS